MDGNYQNKKEQFLLYLRNWIEKVISDRLWKNYADLHIDEIDDIFKEKQNWIKGSLFLLDCVLSLIDKTKYDVLLVIPLSCVSNSNQKVNFITVEFLEKELDITPPSFYLFPKGEKNYEETISTSLYLDKISNDLNFKVFYKEENEDEECYRTFYIRG